MTVTGGSVGLWGPLWLCDLSKLPTERKTPEPPVEQPPSFSLHSAAKGGERGDVEANTETKGHLFAYSFIGPVPSLCGVLCGSSLKERTRSCKCSSRGEKVTFLVYAKFSPPRDLCSCCSHHLHRQFLLPSCVSRSAWMAFPQSGFP